MKRSGKCRSDIFAGVKAGSLILASVLAAGVSPSLAGERNTGSDEMRTATFALG
jgi:hypothetical protein